ncbi:hypothetical protein F4777DRAFT_584313 [Nemania sp. FL0916]|nr:hypothetical protein F4777DRAFT_584313 [Nemania sp. FL0916]
MWRPNISNPTIPLGSTVLVTGANGLIAATLVDQLLSAGYYVRGTVRNAAKCSWLVSALENRHGPGRLELIEVPDICKSGAWDAAVRGISGIAHVIGAVTNNDPDVEKHLQTEMVAHISLLEAAQTESKLKSFVLTSSAFAAWTPDASRKAKLGQWDWNQRAIDLARSDAAEKGLAPLMALKTLIEQRIWDWVRSRNPRFTFNSILLDTVIGRCLHTKDIGIPSTNGMVQWVYEGVNLDLIALMQPQWFINTRDAALLFIAALTTPGVDGERLFGFGARYSWSKVAEILQQLYPEKNVSTVAENGWDQTEVPNKRSEELLRLVKLAGWTNLEESVKEASECFI